jgi:hypothetical protein
MRSLVAGDISVFMVVFVVMVSMYMNFIVVHWEEKMRTAASARALSRTNPETFDLSSQPAAHPVRPRRAASTDDQDPEIAITEEKQEDSVDPW